MRNFAKFHQCLCLLILSSPACAGGIRPGFPDPPPPRPPAPPVYFWDVIQDLNTGKCFVAQEHPGDMGGRLRAKAPNEAEARQQLQVEIGRGLCDCDVRLASCN